MRSPWTRLTILIVLLAFGKTIADAQVSAPQLVKMQGYLTNASGTPQTGTFTMTFTLYDSQFPGGTSVATVGPLSVTASSGLYDVDLSLPSSAFTGSVSRYLEVTVNGEVQTPRIQMASAPFCYQAEKLDGLDGSELVKKAGDTMTGALTVAGTITTTGVVFPGGTQTVPYTGASGGGSLDQAYNFNGAGLGRTINANSGAVNIAGSSGLTVNGNVGIGTTNPGEKLDVNGVIRIKTATPNGTLRFDSAANYTFGFLAEGANPNDRFSLIDYTYGPARYRMTLLDNGNIGIGTTTPSKALEVKSATGDAEIGVRSGDAGGVLWTIQSSNTSAGGGGTFQIVDRTHGMSLMQIDPSTHIVAVPVLQITGGSDIAEPFVISSTGTPEGAVLIIDEDHPGQLKLSEHSYDRRVAGIVSGANGIKPGISLRQDGALAGGQNVALSGRVYALADASYGAIRAGGFAYDVGYARTLYEGVRSLNGPGRDHRKGDEFSGAGQGHGVGVGIPAVAIPTTPA